MLRSFYKLSSLHCPFRLVPWGKWTKSPSCAELRARVVSRVRLVEHPPPPIGTPCQRARRRVRVFLRRGLLSPARGGKASRVLTTRSRPPLRQSIARAS